MCFSGNGRLGPERLAHVELDVLGEDDPDHAHQLVGERDDRLVLAATCDQLGDPATLGMVMPIRPADDRTRAVDEHDAQAAIAVLGDGAQLGLAASAMLARHQPGPCGATACVLEVLRVAEAGQQGRGDRGPDAGDGEQAVMGRIERGQGGDAPHDVRDLFTGVANFRQQPVQGLACDVRQRVFGIAQRQGKFFE